MWWWFEERLIRLGVAMGSLFNRKLYRVIGINSDQFDLALLFNKEVETAQRSLRDNLLGLKGAHPASGCIVCSIRGHLCMTEVWR